MRLNGNKNIVFISKVFVIYKCLFGGFGTIFSIHFQAMNTVYSCFCVSDPFKKINLDCGIITCLTTDLITQYKHTQNRPEVCCFSTQLSESSPPQTLTSRCESLCLHIDFRFTLKKKPSMTHYIADYTNYYIKCTKGNNRTVFYAV